MSGIIAAATAATFQGFARTYTSGSGTENTPGGATQVVIELVGAGGGGGRRGTSAASGGGGGAYCKKTIALTTPTSYAYSVGAIGVGATVNGDGTAGAASTITSPALSAGGGIGGLQSGVNVAGGAASGGDTNTSGGSSTGGTGQAGAGGAPLGGAGGITGPAAGTAPGGGGGGGDGSAGFNGGNGALGRIIFTYS